MPAYLAFAFFAFRLGVRAVRGLLADAKHPKGADVLTKVCIYTTISHLFEQVLLD